MAPKKQPKGCPPFKDITNTTRADVNTDSAEPTISEEKPPQVDSRQRKLQRKRELAREKYAQMPDDEKQALLQKQHEYRQKKKAASNISNQVQHQVIATPVVTNMGGSKGASPHQTPYYLCD